MQICPYCDRAIRNETEKFIDAVEGFTEQNGFPPTTEEIAEWCGIKRSTVRGRLQMAQVLGRLALKKGCLADWIEDPDRDGFRTDWRIVTRAAE